MSSQADPRGGESNCPSTGTHQADTTPGGRITSAGGALRTWFSQRDLRLRQLRSLPGVALVSGHSARPVSQRVRMFIKLTLAVVLLLAPVSGVAGAGLGPLTVIPSPSPGVNQGYADTYRVLANNDEDVSPDEISYGGYFQSDYPLGPTELKSDTQSPSQTLRYAATQDVYVKEVSDFEAIPFQDRWTRYADIYSYQETEFLLAHGLTTYDGPTSTDGKWYVRVTSPYGGEWRPVYNAEVRWDPGREEHYVANPEDALVHNARYSNTYARNLHAASQYSRYAQDPDRVAIPTMGGRELYPTSNGASMSRKWQSDFDVVRDSWVGINHVFGGVWYRDSYVLAGSPTRGAYVPFDHRVVVPPDYSFEDQCRIEHIHTWPHEHDDNTTHIHNYTHYHYHDRTKWVEYELNYTYANVTSLRLDSPTISGETEWAKFGDTTWIAIDKNTSRPLEYDRGEYNLTATLEINTSIETRWGVRSSRCNEYTRSRNRTYTHTTQYSVPVTITDWNSPDLRIHVTHIDGEGDDRLLVSWGGNQDLTQDPWKEIQVEIDGKVVEIDSPWRFYGVSRNDGVLVKDGDDTLTYPATHTQNDRWPAIYHYQTSVANVSMEFPRRQDDVRTQRWGYLEPVDSQIVAQPGGAPLPLGVNDLDNEAPSELYGQYVVAVNSDDLATGETATATADTPFGGNINRLTVSTKPYTPTVLRVIDVAASSTGTGHEGTLILTDESGNAVSGKTITVRQIDGTAWTVTTNSRGRAAITWDGVSLRARYEGDVWDTGPRDPYYKGDNILYLVPPGDITFTAVGTIGEYISGAINNTLIFVEWIALGIFAFWYVRMRRRTTKRGGGKKA